MPQHRDEPSRRPVTAAAGSARRHRRAEAEPDKPTFVRSLDDLSGADLAFAGEHGARIATQPDARPGFVIGAPAYAQMRDAGDLRCRLVEALCDVSAADRGRLMGAALLARSLVGAEPLPAALADELERTYRALLRDDREAPVLVSVSEPMPVGVEGPTVEAHGTGSFFRAVHHCWAALYDPRRVLARAQRGLPQVDVDVALVVQRMPRD
jgi:phosphoenolpyruvate synthase/pyruvate phosphate dikinase